MEKWNFSRWFKFIVLIFSKGSIWIKPYDYAYHIQQLWDSNTEAQKLGVGYDKPNGSWKRSLLYLPVIGPFVAMISHYRLQKQWPTYVYHWPEKKLAYIRISKNGGTSVQAAILQKQHPDINISMLSVNQINEMGKMFIKPFLEPGYECFTLVRDPFQRLLSCYFDQVVGREKRFYFDDYNFRIIKKDMPFDEFVEVISKIPEELMDLHFRPQYNYIKNVQKVKFFRIEEDSQELKEYLGCFGLKLDRFNINESKVNYKDYYTSLNKEIIARIYQKDFDHFKYANHSIAV